MQAYANATSLQTISQPNLEYEFNLISFTGALLCNKMVEWLLVNKRLINIMSASYKWLLNIAQEVDSLWPAAHRH